MKKTAVLASAILAGALSMLCGCESILGGGGQESSTPGRSYSALSADRLEKIKASGSFRVAVCPGSPPFVAKEDGKLSGLELEIVDAVSREIKLKPQYIEIHREEASGMLRDGSCDLLCGAFDASSLQRQYLKPAMEYLPSGLRAIVRREAANFLGDPSQLNSSQITLITIAGGNGSITAGRLFPLAQQVSVPNFEKGLEELKAGDSRVLLVSNVELLKRGNLAADPDVKTVFGFLTNEKMAFGLRRGDDGFEKLLGIGFRRATLSGEIGNILGQRFPNVSAGIVDVKNGDEAMPIDVKLRTSP